MSARVDSGTPDSLNRIPVVWRCVSTGRGIRLELLEEPVKILAVEYQAGTLEHGDQVRPPLRIECAALDADVLEPALPGITSRRGVLEGNRGIERDESATKFIASGALPWVSR